jgi:aspartate/methionine/tyrosine aminotransferase
MVPVGPETCYGLSAVLAEAAWVPGIRAVLVATPANPTGALLSPAELRALHTVCRARGAALIVDEIYSGLVYDAADHSVLELGSEALFAINSFSKYFGMTGWRVGWVAAPADAVDTLERLAQNLFIAAGTLAQHAACAAFVPETLAILERRRALFQDRRDRLLPGLRALGFRVSGDPAGAFYIYARLPAALGLDSMDYATRLLEEAGVALVPGADFGERDAHRYVRLAYTRDLADLRQSLERLAEFGAVEMGFG